MSTIRKGDEPKDGRCCACGADDPPGTHEYPCPKREDNTHCQHWYEIEED